MSTNFRRDFLTWTGCMLLLANFLCVGGAAADVSARHAADLQLDEHAPSDQARYDAMNDRLAALDGIVDASPNSWDSYHLAKAKAWLAFAFDSRAQRDASGVVQAALAQSTLLAEGIERHDPTLSLDTPLIGSATRLREDLWQRAEAIKRLATHRCANGVLAQYEVQLVQAGYADHVLGLRHARPYLQAVDRLAKDADARVAGCPPSTAPLAGTRPVTQPLPPVTHAVAPLPQPLPLAVPQPTVQVANQHVPSAAERPTVDPISMQPPAMELLIPESLPLDTRAQPLAIPVPGRVHFALNRATLGPAGKRELDAVAQVLRQDSGSQIELRGNTDARGSAAYNRRLSRRRAEHVAQYLVASGISRIRISVRALGKTDPLTRGHSRLDHARNRRVDLRVAGWPDPDMAALGTGQYIASRRGRKKAARRS